MILRTGELKKEKIDEKWVIAVTTILITLVQC
jgi:hypothetical protein